MRLDKYLKVSRLIKRRSVAAEACGQGRVELNGKQAKASAEVNIGDKIGLSFGSRYLEVEVTSIAEHAPKGEAALLYRVCEDGVV